MPDAPFCPCGTPRRPPAPARRSNGVSLDVSKGEMIALIVRRAQASPPCLRSISGLQTIDGVKGVIEAFGQAVQSEGGSPARCARRASASLHLPAVSPGGPADPVHQCGARQLGGSRFVRGVFGAWPKETQAAVMAALARVGVADYAAQRANKRSRRQQQRGRDRPRPGAAGQDILADEPVASLDPVSAAKVIGDPVRPQPHRRPDRGGTLHQVDYALRYCKRVVALQGRARSSMMGPPRTREQATHRYLRPNTRTCSGKEPPNDAALDRRACS